MLEYKWEKFRYIKISEVSIKLFVASCDTLFTFKSNSIYAFIY